MRIAITALLLATSSAWLSGCGAASAAGENAPPAPAGTPVAVREGPVEQTIEASGRAEPLEQATIGTRLMGQVLEVAVREGDRVAQGALLVRIDASDLDARRRQGEAQLTQADAALREARLTAGRLRSLYADSAAPKAQLDAAEAGLARTEAAVSQAQAALAEVDAMRAYADLRAPFAGTVTQRLVDPGAFAAPGAPLITLQASARLRIVATAGPTALRGLRRGTVLDVVIEGVRARGTVEGVVPSSGGQSYAVNVVVDNADGRFLPQSAATVLLPQGAHAGLLVPAAAVTHDGDLAGVRLTRGGTSELRWIRLGDRAGDAIEVLSGLTSGDTVLVPAVAGVR